MPPAEDLPVGIVSPVRLCRRNAAIRPLAMKRILRQLGVSVTAYLRWTGEQSFADFIRMNPTWSLRAWQVLIIENLEGLRA